MVSSITLAAIGSPLPAEIRATSSIRGSNGVSSPNPFLPPQGATSESFGEDQNGQQVKGGGARGPEEYAPSPLIAIPPSGDGGRSVESSGCQSAADEAKDKDCLERASVASSDKTAFWTAFVGVVGVIAIGSTFAMNRRDSFERRRAARELGKIGAADCRVIGIELVPDWFHSLKFGGVTVVGVKITNTGRRADRCALQMQACAYEHSGSFVLIEDYRVGLPPLARGAPHVERIVMGSRSFGPRPGPALSSGPVDRVDGIVLRGVIIFSGEDGIVENRFEFRTDPSNRGNHRSIEHNADDK